MHVGSNVKNGLFAIAVTGIATIATAHPAKADPIEGKWATPVGETVHVVSCAASWCGTVITGKYAGSKIAKFTGAGGSYKVSITEPKNGRTAKGTAAINGDVLHLEGCIGGLLCATRDWRRM